MFSTFFMMRGICDAIEATGKILKIAIFYSKYRICIHKSIEFNIDTRRFPAIFTSYRYLSKTYDTLDLKHMTPSTNMTSIFPSKALLNHYQVDVNITKVLSSSLK